VGEFTNHENDKTWRLYSSASPPKDYSKTNMVKLIYVDIWYGGKMTHKIYKIFHRK